MCTKARAEPGDWPIRSGADPSFPPSAPHFLHSCEVPLVESTRFKAQVPRPTNNRLHLCLLRITDCLHPVVHLYAVNHISYTSRILKSPEVWHTNTPLRFIYGKYKYASRAQTLCAEWHQEALTEKGDFKELWRRSDWPVIERHWRLWRGGLGNGSRWHLRILPDEESATCSSCFLVS